MNLRGRRPADASARPGAAAGRLTVQAAPAFRTRHANPYNALLYQHLQERGTVVEEVSLRRLLLAPPDVVHVHWPELTFLSGRRWWRTAWRTGSFLLALGLARARRGTRLVWTVHNITPHESGGPQHRWFWRVFSANVDGVLALTEAAVAGARTAHPALEGAHAAVTPHGDYRSEVDRGMTRRAARALVDLPAGARVVLFVGQVRPYKRVPDLLRTFARLEAPDARLVVAGQLRPGPDADEVRGLAARDPRVVLDLGFLPAERLSAWLRAADLVVLPYSAVLNSGAALLALSADRPVLVPALGALPELQAAVGEEWVRTYSDDLDARVLQDGLAWAVEGRRSEEPDLSQHSWPRVAELTEEAYLAVRGGGRRQP